MEIKRLVVGMVETNCYIAVHPETKEAIIVDPGDEAMRIESAVRQLGAEVKAVLLTHGHFDHMTAAKALKETFQVPVYAHRAEAEILADPAKNLSAQFQGGGFGAKADVLLEDGETFEAAGYTFRLIHTPGHTAGSCCYYVEAEKILFSGDTLFDGSYGRIDFPTGNARQMVRSVAEVLFDLPDAVKVYPGHMGFTTIGDEKKYNPLAEYRGRGL
ncbi:MAG: MBL fold metallo-hydrolase [Clostridium sp.]|jgi:hydroxyacylglutathione hydrolase